MANKSRTAVQTAINTNLADNSTGNISAADTRGTQTDLNDSAFNIISDNADVIVDGDAKVLMIPAERTKLGFIDVSLPVNLDTQQALVASAEQTANKNVANGYAGLDASAQILASQIPAIAITEFLGTVANQAGMLALTGQKGDWCLRSDLGTNFVITGTDPSVIAGWTQLSYPASPVVSVNSQVGTVILNSDDISDSGFANKFVTAADIITLSNTSGTNTGDQTASSLGAVTVTGNQSIGGDKIFTGSTVAGSLAAYRPVGTNLDVTGTPYLISTLTQNQFYNCDASGGVVTIDVDANDIVAPIGTEFEFSPIDLTNDIEFVFSNSQTINSVDGNLKLDKVYSGSILKKTAVDTWTLIGTLKA